jgi:plasmid maintenance system antidote protein VapI
MKQLPPRYRATNVVLTIRDQGRTVSWLARRIGVSRQYTSSVVHGHIDVAEPVAIRIATEIGVPFFLLFEVSKSSEINPDRVDAEVLV